jgi:hypothetical protein
VRPEEFDEEDPVDDGALNEFKVPPDPVGVAEIGVERGPSATALTAVTA